MKTLMRMMLGSLYCIAIQQLNAETNPAPEYPTFSAVTANTGRGTEKGTDAAGAHFAYQTLKTGVACSVFFQRGPFAIYGLEVFFIAEDKSSKKLYVYDFVREPHKEPSLKTTINAVPLRRKGAKWTVLGSGTGMTRSGESVHVTLIQSEPIPTCVFKGWIARVFSAGVPVRVESSDAGLLKMAKENPQMLNQIEEDK